MLAQEYDQSANAQQDAQEVHTKISRPLHVGVGILACDEAGSRQWQVERKKRCAATQVRQANLRIPSSAVNEDGNLRVGKHFYGFAAQ